MMAVLCASLLNAVVSVLSRSLQKVPFAVLLFCDSFVGCFISGFILSVAVSVFIRPLYFLTFAPFENGLLLIASVMSALAVMCQTIAYQSSNSSFVALCSFLNLVYAMCADVLVF